MTEQEWLASTDPQAMLGALTRRPQAGGTPWPQPSDRKLRLFSLACSERYGVEADLDPERDRIGDDLRWATAWASHSILQSDGRVYNYHTGRAKPDIRASLLRDVFGNPWAQKSPVGLYRDWFCWNDSTVPRLARQIYEERAWERMPLLADALLDAGCDDEELMRHCRGMERCLECLGTGIMHYVADGVKHARWRVPLDAPCDQCGSGWIPLRGPHVRGCHVLDLLMGRD